MGSRLHSKRGSTALDYILVIALVSAAIFPIVNSLFGGRLFGLFLSNRQKFVDFIAQNKPRPNVPTEWFSDDKVANIKADDIDQPGQLTVGQLDNPGQLNNKDLDQPGQINPGDLQD